MTERRSRVIRVFSPFDPFPPTDGTRWVVADQVITLRELHYEVDLRHWLRPETSEPLLARASRVVQSFVSDSASPELYYYPRTQLDPANLPPAALEVYIYSFAYEWLRRLPPATPGTRRAVYFHNLESELFEQRAQAAGPGIVSQLHRRTARRLREHETALAAITDEQWFVSPVDLEAYRASAPGANARFVPPGVARELHERRARAFDRAPDAGKVCAGILGRFDFGPNRASLEWVLAQLCPALARRSFAGEIDVIGRHVPEELAGLAARYSFVKLRGFVPDLEPYWQRWSYTLVPHVHGSGVRIKLLESLGSGVPVVANRAAFEALAPGLRESVIARELDEPEGWADTLTRRAPLQDRRALVGRGLPADLDLPRIFSFVSALLE